MEEGSLYLALHRLETELERWDVLVAAIARVLETA